MNCGLCGKDVLSKIHHSGEHGEPICCECAHPTMVCPQLFSAESPFEGESASSSPDSAIKKPSTAGPVTAPVPKGSGNSNSCPPSNSQESTPASRKHRRDREVVSVKRFNLAAEGERIISIIPPTEVFISGGVPPGSEEGKLTVGVSTPVQDSSAGKGIGQGQQVKPASVEIEGQENERSKMAEGEVKDKVIPKAMISVDHRPGHWGKVYHLWDKEGREIVHQEKDALKMARAIIKIAGEKS